MGFFKLFMINFQLEDEDETTPAMAPDVPLGLQSDSLDEPLVPALTDTTWLNAGASYPARPSPFRLRGIGGRPPDRGRQIR